MTVPITLSIPFMEFDIVVDDNRYTHECDIELSIPFMEFCNGGVRVLRGMGDHVVNAFNSIYGIQEETTYR